jgi:FtsZ-binding cell division protein ZapB
MQQYLFQNESEYESQYVSQHEELPTEFIAEPVYEYTVPVNDHVIDHVKEFDFFKFLENNIDIQLNMFQVIVFCLVTFFVTCCIPRNRFGAKIQKLEDTITELIEKTNKFEDKIKESEEEKNKLQEKCEQLENENAFLVSRLKKLEEKNLILVNSLEEFITKKYATHPYNLRKKEKVDYTSQLNTSSNTSTKAEEDDSDYHE